MSVSFNQRRGWWEYDFQYQKKRYTGAGFQTKKTALAEEAERKKEIKKPKKPEQTDMAFLELCNRRLDFLDAYRGKRHYTDTVYLAKKWIKAWNDKNVHQITPRMVQQYLLSVNKSVSANQANKELISLKAMFNWGIKKPNRWFMYNPTDDLEFFRVESRNKYVPPLQDVIAVLLASSGETQDYLWTIALTLARMSEVNRMVWDDVDFENGTVTLYTRKSRSGNLTPRKIMMTKTLRDALLRRLDGNNTKWVFPHTYFSRKDGDWVTGPYTDRKRIMKTLCKKAGVRYFRFHPLRHFGASMLMREGVDPRTIQDILGHSNFKTTEIYLHSFGGSNQEAMDKLEKKLNWSENMVKFEKSQT